MGKESKQKLVDFDNIIINWSNILYDQQQQISKSINLRDTISFYEMLMQFIIVDNFY